MELLESAIAFAVAMIIFSTITTGIVELILRVLGSRKKNVEDTVRSLFDTVVWPRMKSRLLTSQSEKEADAKKRFGDQFVQDMTKNPASAPLADEAKSSGKSRKGQIDVLTPMAFAERLGRTEVGERILAEGEVQLELVIRDFVRTFDRFGRAANELFRKKAQFFAVAVGIVFAVSANVDAARLFTTLMENPDLRSGLIAESENAAKANEEAAKSLADIVKRLEEGKLDGDPKKLVEKHMAEVKASVSALETRGLPIGYAFYPYCSEGPGSDPACQGVKYPWKDVPESFWSSGLWWASVGHFSRWVLLAALAGVLIGLGGPFWYRVFTSLSQIFQVLRSFGIARNPQQAKPEEVVPLPSAQESAKPKDVVDAFKVAAQVHAHSSVPGERALLGPDGVPL